MSKTPRPPPGLEVAILEGDGEDLAVFSWPVQPPGIPPDLSAAEGEVVRLALRGLSNVEIARLRGRAARTVANQLASAFRKLGVGSRAELAALLAGGAQKMIP